MSRQRYFRVTTPDAGHPYTPETLSEILLLDEDYTDSGWENDFQPKGQPVLGLVRWSDIGKRPRARHVIYAHKREVTEVWQAGASGVPDGVYTATVENGVAYLQRVPAQP